MSFPSEKTLTDYHRPVLKALNQERHQLHLKDATSVKELALSRWELMRHLRAYQLFKHSRIFDPIIRQSSARSAFATTLKLRCIAVAEAYEAHVKKWSLSGPALAWEEYRADAIAISARIEEHIALETEQVAKLLAMPD